MILIDEIKTGLRFVEHEGHGIRGKDVEGDPQVTGKKRFTPQNGSLTGITKHVFLSEVGEFWKRQVIANSQNPEQDATHYGILVAHMQDGTTLAFSIHRREFQEVLSPSGEGIRPYSSWTSPDFGSSDDPVSRDGIVDFKSFIDENWGVFNSLELRIPIPHRDGSSFSVMMVPSGDGMGMQNRDFTDAHHFASIGFFGRSPPYPKTTLKERYGVGVIRCNVNNPFPPLSVT